MTDLTQRNFGLLIAYVLPGFVLLAGVSLVSPMAQSWLAQAAIGPSVGGFLYAFLFSVAGGVTVSAVRWLLLDRFHQLTGIRRPQLDLANLEECTHSFDRVIEAHYRYYEFYGGMLVATLFTYCLWRSQHRGPSLGIYDFSFLTLEIVFALASRDALRNYYGRAARVLGTLDREVPHDERRRSSRRGPHSDEPETTGTAAADKGEGGTARQKGVEDGSAKR